MRCCVPSALLLQVFSTVIVQALLLGLVGSLAGIGLGWGMVKLIASGLANMGMPLTGATNPTVSDMLVGLVVGIVVTLIGAALPARNAALAPPIQAMNETVNPEKPVLARGILGTVMVLLGFLSWGFTYALAAADGDGGPTPWKALNSIAVGWPLGIGAALAVIGVIVAGPAYVSTAGAVLGWLPSKAFTVTGRLAQRNISRSKRRTSNTAAACSWEWRLSAVWAWWPRRRRLRSIRWWIPAQSRFRRIFGFGRADSRPGHQRHQKGRWRESCGVEPCGAWCEI